jgi:membrane protein implicated in regulation of membrane protease activity
MDVYLSMFTLIYFAATAVYRPRRRTWDFLAFALLAVFTYIVAVRVLEILLKP